jgi:hypothetical protein
MPEPALPVRIREANVAEHAAARAWTVVRPCWPNLDLAYLQRLTKLGELFRFTALVWTTSGVDSPQWYVQTRYYQPGLAEWTRAGEFRFLAGLA